jgi:hypothetical protein
MASIRSLAWDGAAREEEEIEQSFNGGLLAEITEEDGPEADSLAMVAMVHDR